MVGEKNRFSAVGRAGRRAEGPKPRPEGYGDFIFNPADLAEDVDLDEEIRKELLFVDAHLDDWCHYDLLEVRPGTPPKEIRRRYLELSRRFHPDRYYGKRLGSYGARLSRVFKAVTRAYETLSDPERKAEYDRVTDVPLTEEELAEKEREEQRKKRVAESSKRRRSMLVKKNPFLRKRAKHAELLKEAEAAEAKEDWKQAANLLKLAKSYHSDDVALEAKLKEVDKKAKAQRALELVERAESATLVGSQEEAAALWEEAGESAPRDLEIQLKRARFLLSRGGSDDQVIAATRQAIAAGRGSSQAWTLHGRALLRGGKKREARDAFQKAVKIDPRNEEARSAAKKLKWVLF